MKCPKCAGEVRVRDTTYTEENEIYRRRKCLDCGHVFYTMEFEVEASPEFRKEWRKFHRTAKPNYNRKSRKIYTVYLRKNDNIVASGTAEECAKQMETSIESFRSLVSRANTEKVRKYEVYVSDGTEEELEEE